MAATTHAGRYDALDGDVLEPQPSSWQRGWASWRVALRLARRDLRRHRGRNALITVMVGLPVALLVGGTSLYASYQVTGAERIPFVMGASQALLTPGSEHVVSQQPDGQLTGSTDTSATPIPGWAPGSEAAALEALTGGRVTAVANAVLRIRVDRKVIPVTVLGIGAPSDPTAVGIVTLTSGRWPAGADEVIVTAAGAQRGLPTFGSLTAVLPTGGTTTYTIVGTGSGYRDGFSGPEAVDVVSLPAALPNASPASSPGVGVVGGTSYLLDRASLVTWSDVQRLNGYGILVASREVIAHPPPPEHAPMGTNGSNAGSELAFVGMLAVALMVLTCLLAGPAFAVSAARQRRTLALAASNGATQAQLRRTVLAQALVLGVLAALVYGTLGLLAAAVGQQIGHALSPSRLFGPFDVPWAQVSLVVAAAVVSSVVASLIPARGLARIDVVAAIRGAVTPQPIRRRIPWIGVLVVGIGAATTVFAGLPRGLANPNDPATLNNDNLYGWVLVAGSVLLVIGALLAVPALLLGVARMSTRLPFWVRMATRDSARQRGRATATVAAVLGGSAVLSTALVLLASQGAYNEKHYQPQLPPGTGLVLAGFTGPAGPSTPVAHIRDIIAGVAPAIRVTERSRVDFADNWIQVGNGGGTSASVTQQIQAVRTGCPVDELASVLKDGMRGGNDPCLSIGTQGWGTGGITVLEPQDLATALPMDAQQSAAVAAGAIVVADNAPGQAPDARYTTGPPPSVVDVVNGTVTFVTVSRSKDLNTLTVQRTQSVPAIVVPRSAMKAAFPRELVGGVVTASTAQALGWPVVPNQILIKDPAGPITTDDQHRLQDALQEQLGDATVYVERGYQPVDAIVIAIAIGLVSVLILAATLIATVLSQIEAAPLFGTLAAVGATRGTRRAWSAASAGSLALVGAVVGILVGLVPGIALAATTTGTQWADNVRTTITPTIVIPFLPLVLTAIGAPAVAAAIAWICVRRAPTMTRRLN